MKKLISLLLVLTMVFAVTVPAYAVFPNDDSSDSDFLDDFEDNIISVSESAKKVDALAKDAKALEGFINTISQISKIASYVSAPISLINGSVSFLKLIGVVKDGTSENIKSIMTQIQSIDAKITEMNAKLTEIRDQMASMQSSIDFNARTEKADLLYDRWLNFNQNYLENGLDTLMDEYDTTILNGMVSWCRNTDEGSRIINGVDNSSIYVIYKYTNNEYELYYTTENGLPDDFGENDRCIQIKSEGLPQAIKWNVDTYKSTIQSEISTTILNSLKDPDNSAIVLYNFGSLTSSSSEKDINQIASDAVNTLIYRTAGAQINKDASFTKRVISAYNNYCMHLCSPDEGLDAILKTYFLTHCFESEVSKDITDFCNMLTVKNAVYGTFVMNILGASITASAKEKKTVLNNFNESIKYINQARKNSITGNDNFCYITNTVVQTADIQFTVRAGASTVEASNTDVAYKSSWIEGTKHSISKNGTLLNERQILLLQATAISTGNKFDSKYLLNSTKSTDATETGKIVTSFSENVPFSFDGTTLHVSRAFGDYFKADSLTNLPAKADEDYITYSTKVTGGVFDIESRKTNTNATILAIAVYGESHWYWKTDECAFLSGPADGSNYSYGLTRSYSGDGNYQYSLYVQTTYNVLISNQLSSDLLKDDNGYNPLSSYIELCEEFDYTTPTEPDKPEPDNPNILNKIANIISKIITNVKGFLFGKIFKLVIDFIGGIFNKSF